MLGSLILGLPAGLAMAALWDLARQRLSPALVRGSGKDPRKTDAKERLIFSVTSFFGIRSMAPCGLACPDQTHVSGKSRKWEDLATIACLSFMF